MHFAFSVVFFGFLTLFGRCAADNHKEHLARKLHATIPDWINEQINEDFAPFRNASISRSELQNYYETHSTDLFLVKFTIRNNKIHTECKVKNSGIEYRSEAFEKALRDIAEVAPLPDAVFLISMHDAFGIAAKVPIFGMCKRYPDKATILIPDFDALRAKFQVLKRKDLTREAPSWERKRNQLIWRGSTAQGSLDGELMRPDNVHRFSRVILCGLSQSYPHLIDAKFTFFAQGGEHIPSLQAFQAKSMPFEELMLYKYQIFIDGNVSAYSASGWKFFTNSLIFKPESQWIQWYYGALKPYVHYIPIKEDLADLVEKVQWARDHDGEAKALAKNCREFALTHLTLPDNLLYLYWAISQYSHL